MNILQMMMRDTLKEITEALFSSPNYALQLETEVRSSMPGQAIIKASVVDECSRDICEPINMLIPTNEIYQQLSTASGMPYEVVLTSVGLMIGCPPSDYAEEALRAVCARGMDTGGAAATYLAACDAKRAIETSDGAGLAPLE